MFSADPGGQRLLKIARPCGIAITQPSARAPSALRGQRFLRLVWANSVGGMNYCSFCPHDIFVRFTSKVRTWVIIDIITVIATAKHKVLLLLPLLNPLRIPHNPIVIPGWTICIISCIINCIHDWTLLLTGEELSLDPQRQTTRRDDKCTSSLPSTNSEDNKEQQMDTCNNQLERRGTRVINQDNEVQQYQLVDVGLWHGKHLRGMKMMKRDDNNEQRQETKARGNEEDACYVRQRRGQWGRYATINNQLQDDNNDKRYNKDEGQGQGMTRRTSCT